MQPIDHPVIPVLFAVDPPDESSLAALRDVAAPLINQHRDWSTKPPQIINDEDASTCTRPEDVPIRTVGLLWEVNNAYGEIDQRQYTREFDDFCMILDKLSPLTMTGGRQVTVVYNGEHVGAIVGGVPDEYLRRGLIEPWATATGRASWPRME